MKPNISEIYKDQEELIISNIDKIKNKEGIYQKVLGLTKNQLSDFSSVRKAFRKKMIQSTLTRQKRIALNIVYFQVCNKIFKTQYDNDSTILKLILQGKLQILQVLIQKNKSLLNKVVYEYPLIYYAVRAGHYDIVQFFLNADNLPISQAATNQIKTLLENGEKNRIHSLQQKILSQELGYQTINIKYQNKIVFKKILLKSFKNNYPNYDNAFHGTKFGYLQSIAKHGLGFPGDEVDGKVIQIQPGHIGLKRQLFGKKNWGKAIFLSPSVFYSAHPVYSKQIIVDGKQTWLPLVQVKVKKGTYTRHDHTLKSYKNLEGEPTSLEFRVECDDDAQNLIIRTQDKQNVKVIAILFIIKGFLDSHSNFKQVTDLILNSAQEQQFKKYYS